MPPHSAHPADISIAFTEIGAAVLGLALLSRVSSRWGFSAIPLYLLAGLAFGNGGLLPLHVSEGFTRVGAEIGVLLLLFMLGLEYTGEELGGSLARGWPAGLVDLALNFAPGFAAGLILGWGVLAAVVLGGVTWISSSGVISKLLTELRRMGSPETPAVLSVLVVEDLAMAVYLPLLSVLLAGRSLASGVGSVVIALATVGAALLISIRFGRAISRTLCHQSDEVLLLTTFGIVLLAAGVAPRLHVSAAVGAFLVGIALSGAVAERAREIVAPLRDLFAATFFFFFGMQIDPAALPPVLVPALLLGIVSALTKIATGWWAARRAGNDAAGGLRAGATLIARGEFSIVIAGLGVGAGLAPTLGPLSAAYVLFLAILGPIVARAAPAPR